MTTIRILQVFTSMGRGGAESMIMNYYRRIDRSKIQFDFLVHRQERAAFDDEIEQLGGTIYRLRPIDPFFPSTYYSELRAFFKQHNNYNVIHSHLNTFSYFPLKIAQEYNISTRIAHAHIAMDSINIKKALTSKSNIIEALKKIVKLRLKKKIHTHTTHYFSCGEKAGKWLFGNKTDFYTMNNAIDSKKFAFNKMTSIALKKEYGLENNIVLGHIGRFTYQKNHLYLLKILAELVKNKDSYVMVLIGDGPHQQKIKEAAEVMGLGRHVKFLGLKTNIAELLQMIDIFVFPSIYEGLPVTLIEAQAAGLKILASDTITTEVTLTNGIIFLSIEKPVNIWCKEILQLGLTQKKNNTKLIIKGNYDIENNCREIEKFYHNQNLK